MDEKKLNEVCKNPLENIVSAMESEVKLKVKTKVKALMLISIALANYAANEECDKPGEAYAIKEEIDDVVIEHLLESLEVD